MPPHVAVVILSWNGREDLLECLSSMEEVRWEALTTVVVDNGSTDGTSEAVRDRNPEVELVRCESNLGFAEGNNVGLRRALELGAHYCFVLNNDTRLDPRILSELVSVAESRPETGAVCPLVYFEDEPDLVWYAGGTWEPSKSYNGRLAGYGERDGGQWTEVQEVGRATGAAMLVPRRVLETVGLLDPALYLHVEDVEWSLRMREAGYKIYLAPAARMWHKVSRGTGGETSPTIAYYDMRNTLEVSARYAPAGRVRRVRRELTTLAVHLVHLRRAKRPAENLRSVLQGWRDYRAGRLGPRAGAPSSDA